MAGVLPIILERVGKKEARLGADRETCAASAYWLLLCTDESFAAEVRQSEIPSSAIQSHFDAVAIVCAFRAS